MVVSSVLCWADHENIGYELSEYKCCGGEWRVVVSGTLSLSPGVSLECLHFMILTRGGSESEPGQAREGEE